MHLVAIAWLYVALMMAAAEATHVNGSLLGAAITFLLYGLGPVALVLYVLGAPARRKAIRQRERAEFERQREQASASSAQADGVSHPDTASAALQPDSPDRESRR